MNIFSQSSNGIYVGLKRIPSNSPYSVSDADVIGFGWTIGAPLTQILDDEKYVFKLVKCVTPLKNRILFQSYIDVEDEITDININEENVPKVERVSPVLETKSNLKRKLQVESKPLQLLKNNDIINVSDSDNDLVSNNIKKKKLGEPNVLLTEAEIKSEADDIQYEAFSVKQEYLGYDEAIEISSDNDSDSELFVRLSQSSPRKTYMQMDRSNINGDKPQENSSYSQLDDDVIFVNNMGHAFDEDDFIDDIITIPTDPPQNEPPVEINLDSVAEKPKDLVDGISTNVLIDLKEKPSINSSSNQHTTTEIVKKAVMIEPLVKPARRKSHHTHKDSK